MIGYVLTMPDRSHLFIRWDLILPIIQNFPQIVWKYTLIQNAGILNPETNNSAQLCLGDLLETNNRRDTRQKSQFRG